MDVGRHPYLVIILTDDDRILLCRRVIPDPPGRSSGQRPAEASILIPLTDVEIRAIEAAATNPVQRLIVALAVAHAARAATTSTCPTGGLPSLGTISDSVTSPRMRYRLRQDRILHEALTARADPPHLSLVRSA